MLHDFMLMEAQKCNDDVYYRFLYLYVHLYLLIEHVTSTFVLIFLCTNCLDVRSFEMKSSQFQFG